MTIPDKLVTAAAEGPCIHPSRVYNDCSVRGPRHPVCVIAAAFAALPECEEMEPGGECENSLHVEGWNFCVDALARMAD